MIGDKNDRDFVLFLLLCTAAATAFAQMVPAGMPELAIAEDIQFLKDKLLLGMNEREVRGRAVSSLRWARVQPTYYLAC